MTKFGQIALIGLVGLFCSCEENSEVFYSITYPIVRLEATVTLVEPTPPVDPEQPTDPEQPSTLAEEPEQPEDPIIAQIEADVLATAPVVAGGSYSLDFSQHNGGYLQIIPAPGAEALLGVFVKEPGKTDLNFFYPDHRYVCALNSYTDTDKTRRVMLTEDLTTYYQQLYPEGKIKQVLRNAYTSTKSN